MKNIRGRQFNQQALKADWINTIGGQQFPTKILLIFLGSLFCFCVNILTGYLASISSFSIFSKTDYSLSFILMNFSILVLLYTLVNKGINKSFIAGILIFVMIVSTYFLEAIGIIYLPNRFLFLTFAYILFGFLIYGTSFAANRILGSLIDILLEKNRSLKIFITCINLLAAIIGARSGISQLLASSGDKIVMEALSKLSQTELQFISVIAIATGLLYSLVLMIGAWFANSRRGVPWKHPDLLRDWVLAIGSWKGTSFHNLDLSRVNFKNAKLPNTDLRARKLYRTCFVGVTGLERARVDSRYLDLEIPKVQKLLTRGGSEERNFSQLNLRGAYLQGADLRHINFTDTDLTGADLRGADLRGCIFVRAQVIDVDFTEANLAGICIEDWSVNSQTVFTNVECDYIYRKVDEKGEPTDRSPASRNFEPREFESLYQEVGNVVELVFKEGLNWRAFAFTLQQLQLDGDENLGLELKGIEKRGDLWVVKVTHNENVPRQVVEQKLYVSYEEFNNKIAENEQKINEIMGIISGHETDIKELNRKAFGNSFFIVGSNINNLAGSGEIKYSEAAQQVRNIVSGGVDTTQVLSLSQNFLNQLQQQNVAIAPNLQAELIEQILLAEAEKDPAFKDILLNQGQQAINAMSESAIATAIREAIAQLIQN